MQGIPGRLKPSLVLRTDVANVYGTKLPRTLFSRMIEKPVEQALRVDAACVVVNLFLIPEQPEVADQCIQNILRIKPECERYGMPLMPPGEYVVFVEAPNLAAMNRTDIPPRLKPFYDFEQHSLLELEPPVHSRLRGLVNRAFLSRQVEQLRPKIEALSNSLIDGFEAKGEVELLSAYATPIPVIVICELLGVPTTMADQLLAWSHAMVAMYMAKRDRAVEDAAVAATVAFSDYMCALVKERRKAPRDDLLSELVRAETEGQKLSEDELITTAILILNAGHEATVHSIGNGVKTLLERGKREPITESLIEEILRFGAPLHLFTRYALEDLDYNGLKLRKGEEVGLLLGAADPRSDGVIAAF